MQTAKSEKQLTDAEFFANIRWPIIVVALLVGHTSLMLVAVTLATADPPELVDETPPAISDTDIDNSQGAYP